MQRLKKYAALFILLSIFPASWFVGRAFITEYSTDLYEYIPQESDIVIEVNNINFIREFAYQRIFHQEYVMERIEFEEVEVKTGIDYFSKILLFREQWADENVWVAVVGFTDKAIFQKYVTSKLEIDHLEFGKRHAILQLSKSSQQEKMDEHLKKIANKDIKPFTSRVDLKKYFESDKEINCYFIPPTSDEDNGIIEGHLHFDFLKDHVEISGNFTPVSGFETTPGIAYQMDEEKAFSLRSSLNVFNSIYWFGQERIEDIPEYSQMALDYDGVKMFMVDKNFGYDFPFKSFPQMEMRFDLIKAEQWHTFFDTLIAQERFRIDTTVNSLTTANGAFFQYKLNEQVFELSNRGVNFEPAGETNVCFNMQFKIAELLDKTKFSVDEDNPPSKLEQTIGLSVAQELIADLHLLDNVEQVKFKLKKNGENRIDADGWVQMKNREGQSIIECMIFAKESIFFLTQAIDVADGMSSAQ